MHNLFGRGIDPEASEISRFLGYLYARNQKETHQENCINPKVISPNEKKIMKIQRRSE